MKPIMIIYDLNRPGQNYSDLHRKIKSLGAWCHPLESTWVVKTNYTTVQARDLLLPFIDNNDELLVVDLKGNGAWTGLSTECSELLRNHLSVSVV